MALVAISVNVLICPLETLFAYKTIYRSYIETDGHKIEFIGSQGDEQFGASIAGGDVNGDGCEDLIVGSPYYSSDGMTWNGKVSVFFGTGDLSKRVYDSFYESPDFIAFGRGSGDQLGISVASGDFNDDGYDDILMGAHNAMSEAEDKRPGRVFLMFGQEKLKKSWILFESKSADIEFVGETDQEAFGLSVQMGDINHDDIDDILVGAPFGLSIDGVKTGKVYGYKGETFHVDNVYSGEKDADVIFTGLEEGERFGADIAIGDIVRGNYDDVIISAYFASGPKGPQTGKVYVYKGVKKYSKYERIPYDTLTGEDSYDWFGFSIDAARAKAQYKDDLLISSFPYLKRSQGGAVYTVYGGANLVVKGKKGENLMGASVAYADLDGDNKNDFVLGAPGIGTVFSSESGEVYIFYRKYLEDGEQFEFDIEKEEMTSYVMGENADDWFGSKIAVLDFNDDGYDDVAISSRYADRFDEKGLISDSNNGKVHLILGHSEPIGEFYMTKEPDDEYITRGEAVKSVVESFDIREKRKSFIDDCYQYREFCFFAFTGQSNFSGLKLEPELVLYPDIPHGSKYYESVTIATMLELVCGFGGEKETPFKPDGYMTRIQALKIVLGATSLVKPLYRFELINSLGSLEALEAQPSYYVDVDPSISHMWWYPMFSNFAYENNLVEGKMYFRPDDYITKAELNYMIERTLEVWGGDEAGT